MNINDSIMVFHENIVGGRGRYVSSRTLYNDRYTGLARSSSVEGS